MHDNIFRDTNYVEIKKLVSLSIFISIAILLSIIESFIPIPFILPGVKLGLSNIVLLLLLPHYNFRSLLFFQFTRITITAFVLGLFSTYMFSLTAGIIALTVTFLFYKLFYSVISVYTLSIIGAVTHNISQLIVASLYINAFSMLTYIFPLVVAAVVMGFIVALIVDKKLDVIKRKLNDDSIKELFS